MCAPQRNFYELAAEIAHQGIERVKLQVLPPVNEEFMLRSHILEADYQDCLFAFLANGQRLSKGSVNGLALAKALNKFCEGRVVDDAQGLLDIDAKHLARDLNFLFSEASKAIDWPDQCVLHASQLYRPEEIVALLLWVTRQELPSLLASPSVDLDAVTFHHELTKMMHPKIRRPFIVKGDMGKGECSLLIDRASLFSANRLRKKSWQNNCGVEVGVRYYHAALRSSKEVDGQLDISYWLKLDENHQIIGGDFITTATPRKSENLSIRLSSPWSRLLDKAKNSALKAPEHLLVSEVIGLYLDSLNK